MKVAAVAAVAGIAATAFNAERGGDVSSADRQLRRRRYRSRTKRNSVQKKYYVCGQQVHFENNDLYISDNFWLVYTPGKAGSTVKSWVPKQFVNNRATPCESRKLKSKFDQGRYPAGNYVQVVGKDAESNGGVGYFYIYHEGICQSVHVDSFDDDEVDAVQHQADVVTMRPATPIVSRDGGVCTALSRRSISTNPSWAPRSCPSGMTEDKDDYRNQHDASYAWKHVTIDGRKFVVHKEFFEKCPDEGMHEVSLPYGWKGIAANVTVWSVKDENDYSMVVDDKHYDVHWIPSWVVQKANNPAEWQTVGREVYIRRSISDGISRWVRVLPRSGGKMTEITCTQPDTKPLPPTTTPKVVTQVVTVAPTKAPTTKAPTIAATTEVVVTTGTEQPGDDDNDDDTENVDVTATKKPETDKPVETTKDQPVTEPTLTDAPAEVSVPPASDPPASDSPAPSTTTKKSGWSFSWR